MSKRIQLSRKKGSRKPPDAVTVSRPTKWGNPFTIGCEAWRFSTTIPFPNPSTIDEVLVDYEYYLRTWLVIYPDWIAPLRGKDLACWCKLDQPCHADVLMKLANNNGKEQ